MRSIIRHSTHTPPHIPSLKNSSNFSQPQNPVNSPPPPPFMAAGISVSLRLTRFEFIGPKPNSITLPACLLSLPIRRGGDAALRFGRRKTTTVRFVVDDKISTQVRNGDEGEDEEGIGKQILAGRVEVKTARKKSERFTYLVAAVMSSLGITSMAVMAVYYRFAWQMEV
ncbi:hypothetical protein RHMOL_Rhmol03G0217100 [Rhododendron molle]|uniref:Uncharacterized protein n=1 Tax=Rhododendron molle TaxID=49168 RepID=A0ACC0PK41_RHOML|nr:hypothetical protein RHMOL_Rhmol03G0217100 [Rhododendron molle]